jgi:hypothetical protein
MNGLDKRLRRLASNFGGKYSRYADDITLSFRRGPGHLKDLVEIDSLGNYEIGKKLSAEIEAEGFESNPSKFRLSTGSSRKIVTGLLVNEKVNLQRRWLRLLECEIYAMEKFGILHLWDDPYPASSDSVREVHVLRRVQGKLAYAAMIRGRYDWVTSGMAFRFNCLHDKKLFKVPDVERISRNERLQLGVWIVAAGHAGDDLFDPPNGNGSAFTIDRGFIVTAHHVIFDEDKKNIFPKITVRREGSPAEMLECDLICESPHHDLAILRLRINNHKETRVRFELGTEATTNDWLTSVGYPDYSPGNTASFQSHQAIGSVVASLVAKTRLNGEISGGMSGGPILDKNLKVAGVVHRGKGNGGFANEAISVSHLVDLLNSIP